MSRRHRDSDVMRAVLEQWEAREWTQKDAYGTSEDGVTILRAGVVVAEGPIKGSPYRRTTRHIPRGLISEALRRKFSKRGSR